MHCSYPGLRIYVLFVDAEESTGLNDEQAASAPLPIKKLIVCPSRKGNDPPGPAHLSRARQLKHNCFWLCLHAYGALRPSVRISVNSNSPVWSLSLPGDNFFFPRTGLHLWNLNGRPASIIPLVSHPSRVHSSAESLRRSLSTLNWKVISLWPRRGYMCDWGDWNYLQIFQKSH